MTFSGLGYRSWKADPISIQSHVVVIRRVKFVDDVRSQVAVAYLELMMKIILSRFSVVLSICFGGFLLLQCCYQRNYFVCTARSSRYRRSGAGDKEVSFLCCARAMSKSITF